MNYDLWLYWMQFLNIFCTDRLYIIRSRSENTIWKYVTEHTWTVYVRRLNTPRVERISFVVYTAFYNRITTVSDKYARGIFGSLNIFTVNWQYYNSPTTFINFAIVRRIITIVMYILLFSRIHRISTFSAGILYTLIYAWCTAWTYLILCIIVNFYATSTRVEHSTWINYYDNNIIICTTSQSCNISRCNTIMRYYATYARMFTIDSPYVSNFAANSKTSSTCEVHTNYQTIIFLYT